MDSIAAAIVGSGQHRHGLDDQTAAEQWTSSRRATWSASTPHRTAWPGPARLGLEASAGGVDWLLEPGTAAGPLCSRRRARNAHVAHAPRYAEAGITRDRPDAGRRRAVRLPAGEPRRQPGRPERQSDHLRRPGDDPDRGRGLAESSRSTMPRSSPRSRPVRPGPALGRTSTSSPRRRRRRIVEVGGASRGKAMIILNPVEPPMIMRNTVFCSIPAEAAEPGALQDAIAANRSMRWSRRSSDYVPGYQLQSDPQFDPPTRHLERHGAGRGLSRGARPRRLSP